MVFSALAKHLLVRGAILLLRAVTPACSIFIGWFIIYRPKALWSRMLLAYCAVEVGFFALLYMPLKYYLQRPAKHPEPLPREELDLIFNRCSGTIKEPEGYLRKWFNNSPIEEIRLDNVKEHLRWAFWGTDDPGAAPQQDIDDFVSRLEDRFGRRFPPGRGSARSLRVTMNDVDSVHRPLIWYLIVGLVDAMTALRLSIAGFSMYREPYPQVLLSFPFRWFTFINRNVSASRNIPYWYRPHTSNTRLPILFIHGTGIGLYPYVGFILELLRMDDVEDDGQVGIIVLELLPISARITTPLPLSKELRTQIHDILKSHGWSKFVLGMHSFGTFVGSQLLHDPDIAPCIGPMLFVDPVVFLLHLPDVAHNFVARLPSRTMEHVIWYFSGKDLLTRHTLQRRLFWIENVLWKDELRNRDVTVALGGKDVVVDSWTVRKYLLDGREWRSNEAWTGDGLDFIWFNDFNHAEMFDWKESSRTLAEILREYSAKGRGQQDLLGIE